MHKLVFTQFEFSLELLLAAQVDLAAVGHVVFDVRVAEGAK